VTTDEAVTVLAAALGGAALASLLAMARLAAPPQSLMRVNHRGATVPAVLGGPLVIGGLSTLAVVAMAGAAGWEPGRVGRIGLTLAVVSGVMFVAGAWDDRRGDEADRGFGGHLEALRGGRLTGGVMKIVAGLFAAGAAFALLASAEDVSSSHLVALALLVPATANLFNLLDRAPGRTGKVGLVMGVALIVLGNTAWAIAAAGSLGALVALLGKDLGERAMLGDAGANPLGAVLGLGLGLSLRGPGLWIALGLVIVLNGLSEKVSFSAVIERTPVLRALDGWGRIRE